MYTDCPTCLKEFEIFATHLKAANGVVRCGQCAQEFNALTRLYDSPKVSNANSMDNNEETIDIVDEEMSEREDITIQDAHPTEFDEAAFARDLTMQDETTQDSLQSESTPEGIEEADIEEVIVDEYNVEEIKKAVSEFKESVDSELDELDGLTIEDEEVDAKISLKNKIANIEGNVDPELTALTKLLDEVDEYIPEPQFDSSGANNSEQNKAEETESNTEEKLAEEPATELEHEEVLSVKADEIDAINQAIERIQHDDEKITKELPHKLLLETASSAEPIPELLQEEKPKRNIGMLLFWMVLVLFALLCMLIQAVWFNRDLLLSQYPEYYPEAKQVCDEINKRELFACELRRYQNLSAIQIKERDVRLHPELENTLLINASMINNADLAQDFPNIQLILFGDANERTAYIEIFPDDYLDNSIDKKLGMQPGIPVHFVLEVNGEIESANGFEFHFF